MRTPRSLGAFGVTLVLGLFGATTLMNQCAPAPAPVQRATTIPVGDCYVRTNAQRRAHGLRSLIINLRVASAAQHHSAYQANYVTMTHTGPGGTDAQDRMAITGYRSGWWGENVAAGQRDCATVVTAWMNSPHHRENILNPHFTVIGMGAVRGLNGAIYWTMDLAAPV